MRQDSMPFPDHTPRHTYQEPPIPAAEVSSPGPVAYAEGAAPEPTDREIYDGLVRKFTDELPPAPDTFSMESIRRSVRYGAMGLTALNQLNPGEQAYLAAAEERYGLRVQAMAVEIPWGPGETYDSHQQREQMTRRVARQRLVIARTGEWLGDRAEDMLAQSTQTRPYARVAAGLLSSFLRPGSSHFHVNYGIDELQGSLGVSSLQARGIIDVLVEDGVLQPVDGTYHYTFRSVGRASVPVIISS